MAEITIYPDAHVESSSVDGRTYQIYSGGEGVVWNTIVGNAGNAAADSEASAYFCGVYSDTVSNEWVRLYRGIFLFDVSAMGAGATVNSATLSLYGEAKLDNLSITPDINIYASAPASNTAVAAGDFDSLGTTAFSSVIAYGDWSTVGYNAFVLTEGGEDHIETGLGADGIAKFGARNANYDVAEELDPGNHAPNWSSSTDSNLKAFFADETGTTKDPKLVIDYTSGVTEFSETITDALSLAEVTAKSSVFSKTLTSVLSLADAVTRLTTFSKTVTSVLSLADTITKSVGYLFTKTITLTLRTVKILVGPIWEKIAKSTKPTWTGDTKHTTTFSEQSKNTTDWTEQDKS